MKLLIILSLVSLCCCEIEFSDRSRNFSIELLHYTQLQTDGHIVISPFGIWTLLTGVALGATGESYVQLRRAFILPKSNKNVINGYKSLTKSVLDPTTEGVTLSSKNFIFLDKNFPVNTNFLKTITGEFEASLKRLDFQDAELAARIANNHIKNTGGKVTNVLKSSDFVESKMILSNVISFKGFWKYQFNKTDTKVEDFFDEDGNKIGQVNMMYQRAQMSYSSMTELKALILELPYGDDNKYSMLILLPHPGTKVIDMYKNFAKVSLKDVLKRLQSDTDEYGNEDVDIKIPRFKISTNAVMNKPLNDMGVYDIFDQRLASFEKVTSSDNIFVSAIVHKADIEVTETGTVASAASTATFSDRISTPKFYANRPFVYFVMEKTTVTVIFGGIYSKPSVF